MENITDVEIHNQEKALHLIRKANLRRQVKKTKSNDSSSRSHAIISLKLEIQRKYEWQLVLESRNSDCFVFKVVKFDMQFSKSLILRVRRPWLRMEQRER